MHIQNILDKQNVIDHIKLKHLSFISVYSWTSTFCKTSTCYTTADKTGSLFFILLERNPFSRFKTINIVLLQFMKQTTNTLIMKQSVLMTSSSNILQASTKQVVMNNGLYYARVIVQCFNSNVTPGLPNTTKSTYIRFTIQKQFLRSNNMLLTWRQKEVLWIQNDRLKHVCIE